MTTTMLRVAATAAASTASRARGATSSHYAPRSFGSSSAALSSVCRAAPRTPPFGGLRQQQQQQRRAPFSSSSSSGSGSSSSSGSGTGATRGGSGAGKDGAKTVTKKKSIPFEPPRMELNPSSNNPLHVQAAKARTLHAELETLLDKQAARRAEEASKPVYHGFVQFLKKSKSEMINIGAAFACVLLAYQIVALRKGARTLVDRTEEREGTLREARGLMSKVQGEEFAREVARKCSQTLEDSGASSPTGRSKKKGGGGLFRWGSSSSAAAAPSSSVTDDNTDPAEEDDDDGDEVAAILRPVILAELRAVIEDAHLSDEQKEEARLRELTQMMGVEVGATKGGGDAIEEKIKASSSGGEASTEKKAPVAVDVQKRGEGESALGGLEEVLKEIATEDPRGIAGDGKGDGDAATKKRIRYAI